MSKEEGQVRDTNFQAFARGINSVTRGEELRAIADMATARADRYGKPLVHPELQREIPMPEHL